jgi:prophage regulatory protein
MRDESSNEDESEPALMTAEQVARTLQISVRSLWRMRAANYVPAPIKVGGSVRWSQDRLNSWIADGCPRTPGRENDRRRI